MPDDSESADSGEKPSMKRPARRETVNRDDMMCPSCLTEGLEEHPGYIDEYGGRVALRKATRCPNEDCENHYGLDIDEIEMQMPDGRLAGLTADIPIRDVGTVILVLAVGVYFGISAGIIPTGTETGTQTPTAASVSGTVEAPNASGQVIVEENGQILRTVDTLASSGSFTVPDIEYGSYDIYFEPDDTDIAATPPTNIELTSTDVSIAEPSDTVASSGNSIQFTPKETQTLSINQTFKSAFYELDYANGANAQSGVEATLYPIKNGTTVRDETASTTDATETTVFSPTVVSDQQIEIQSPVTTEEKTKTDRYDGATQEFQIDGNRNPGAIDITLENSSKAPLQTKQVRVDGPKTAQIRVQSQQTIGPVDITFSDGTATTQQTASGTLSGGATSVDTPSYGFVDATLVVEPQAATSRIEKTGFVQNGTVEETIGGDSPATNGYLNFTGGSESRTTVGTETVAVNGSDGTEQKQEKLVDSIDSGGDFRLTLQPTVSGNEDNTEFSYTANRQQTTISGQTTDRLQLSSGDSVSIQARADGGFQGPTESPYDGDQSKAEITSVTAKQRASESDISVFATVNNPTNTRQTKPLELYVDGSPSISQTRTVEPGETKQFSVGSTSVSGDGTHTIHVSDGPVETYKVGSQPAKYGGGTVEASLQRVGTESIVEVDTTGDGSTDCAVKANGGSCSLGRVETGSARYAVTQKGVSQTGYKLTYEQRVNPKNVSVDTGNDGTIEIQRPGTLTAPVTQDVQLAPESTEIGIQTSNDIPVNYTLAWESQAAINNPTVFIDDEPTLTQTGVFTGPDTRSTQQLSRGEHTVRFDTNEGAYTATIKWRETGEASYPSVQIDGTDVCEPTDFSNNLTCRLTNPQLQPGSHTLDFTGGKSEFNYQLSQKARAVAKTVSLSINDDQSRFSRPTPAPDAWSQRQAINSLIVGKNTFSLDANGINGVNPEATATVLYEYSVSRSKNPEVVVTEPSGSTHTKPIPDTATVDGRLVEPTSISLPQNWFKTGTNQIAVKTSETGAVQMKLEATMSQQGSIDIRFENRQ